jgi:sorting nexin-29
MEGRKDSKRVGKVYYLPYIKKGDKLDCNNYRCITLLDIAYKIFSNVLNERLKKITENLLGEYQCGFRKNRSTSDQIFTIRQMIEKHYEHNHDLHMLFVDFKRAFDSIDRYKLYQVMEDMNISHKLIRLVKMTMKNTTERVKVTNKLSNSFIINAYARQGDGLSPTLFILVLHHGVQRGTIFTKLSQICASADDIVIVARAQKKLTEVYLHLEDETSKFGMEINEKKTKYMVTSTYEHRRNTEDLRIGNKTFEVVQSFQYLGNITSNINNNNNKCIKERTMVGKKA